MEIYSRWDGSQNPWSNADEVLEQLSDDVLESGDLSHALRRLMQRGMSGRMRGLQSIAERLRQRRREELSRYDMDSVVGQITQELDRIRDLEATEVTDRMRLRAESESQPAASDDDDLFAALEREMGEPPFGSKLQERLDYLDRMGDRPADALKSLQRYDFTSPEAEAAFNKLVDEMRQQMMQQFFKGAEQTMSQMTPENLQRTREMMQALNAMIRADAAGEPYDFAGFMNSYGDFFPGNPSNLQELLESLAKRMAAAQAMFESMSPEQRERLMELSEALMGDAELSMQMSELASALEPMMPRTRGYGFSGDDPLEMSEALDVLQRIQDSEELEKYLTGANRPSDLSEVDTDRLRDLLDEEAEVDLKRLAEIEKMLADAGFAQSSGGRLELTPAGIRKIGRQALASVYNKLRGTLAGEHEDRRLGMGGDMTGDTKPYEFGDPFHIQVKETVFEAVRNSGAGVPVQIRPDDFMVERTERTIQAATVLCIDLSLSMPLKGRWIAAKKVGLALHSLITSMFPRDKLFMVGFSDYARELHPEQIPGLGWEEVYGTNLEHALLLARRLLQPYRQAARQIIVVTDGEPTAHLLPDGSAFFDWPSRPETLEATLRQVALCTREKIVINTFMLDDDPSMTRFVEEMTALNRGRAFYTSPDSLGEYVLEDFLESKRTRLRGA